MSLFRASISTQLFHCYKRAHCATTRFQTHRLFSSSYSAMVRVVHKVSEMQALRDECFLKGGKIGFVATMGALHEGHISLLDIAAKPREGVKCNMVVVSIFVNPSQFAPTEDLDKYPRTLDTDIKLIETHLKESKNLSDLDVVVFAPGVSEMYPSGIDVRIENQRGVFVSVLGKSHQLEGKIRPHFFRGVATVVSKLFNAIRPDYAVFGQKDAQQCVVVKQLVRDLLFPLKIVLGPIVREHDGLAKSSRNRYLSSEERAAAPVLYQSLVEIKNAFEKNKAIKADELRKIASDFIKAKNYPNVELEYISIANTSTLDELDGSIDSNSGALVSGAVRVGATRIIDNMVIGIDVQQLGESAQ